MRSTKVDGSPVQARRAWEAPALVELAVGTETKSAGTKEPSATRPCPEAPPAPSAKLGFSFEMSFPLSARTD